MEEKVKITLIIVASIVLLSMLGFSYFNEGTTVNASGIAEVNTEPDVISVYFNVETNASTAKEAKDENAEIVDNVITELVKLGLERKNIVTENFNVYPDYDWANGERKEKGYKAVHRLKVKLSEENKDSIGQVIDEGIDAGALLSYINFELSWDKQNELKVEALRLATEDARNKAEGIASGLDKRVGKVVSVKSQDFGYNPWPIYRTEIATADIGEAKQAVTNIQPGEQEVTGRVEVVFELR